MASAVVEASPPTTDPGATALLADDLAGLVLAASHIGVLEHWTAETPPLDLTAELDGVLDLVLYGIERRPDEHVSAGANSPLGQFEGEPPGEQAQHTFRRRIHGLTGLPLLTCHRPNRVATPWPMPCDAAVISTIAVVCRSTPPFPRPAETPA
jgi:hypothetical protein